MSFLGVYNLTCLDKYFWNYWSLGHYLLE